MRCVDCYMAERVRWWAGYHNPCSACTVRGLANAPRDRAIAHMRGVEAARGRDVAVAMWAQVKAEAARIDAMPVGEGCDWRELVVESQAWARGTDPTPLMGPSTAQRHAGDSAPAKTPAAGQSQSPLTAQSP